ncbi:hypothetical protein ACSV5G_21740 [Agrobacterium cavarae]|uniref:hypothetical protein n=1 Tax=Agrobacterium cavarae TaxID=2528239 RepID=UPI003FD172BA
MGLFVAGAVAAARLASPNRSAPAITFMMIGPTIANVVGLTLGAFISKAAG